MISRTKRITRLALFTALALILSYLESLLPPMIPAAQGVKIGLSNAVVLCSIILLGYSDALCIQIIRCLLGALYNGGLGSLMFSVPAGLFSLAVMCILYRFAFPKVTLMGISIVSSITHNLIQLVIASIVADTIMLYLLPVYCLLSIGTGMIIGFSCFFIVKYLPKRMYI